MRLFKSCWFNDLNNCILVLPHSNLITLTRFDHNFNVLSLLHVLSIATDYCVSHPRHLFLLRKVDVLMYVFSLSTIAFASIEINARIEIEILNKRVCLRLVIKYSCQLFFKQPRLFEIIDDDSTNRLLEQGFPIGGIFTISREGP